MKKAITQIVLLGGGYVSIWAYRSLVKSLRHEIGRGAVRITVICPEEYHFFHGWTAESLTCIIQDQNRMSPLLNVLSKARLINGKAEQIDSSGNVLYIRMKDGTRQAICFDHLLIGIGSYDNEEVEGINEYGYHVKSHEGFLRTKQSIQLIVRQAAESDPATAYRLLTFTIAGGGFSGVELATNIAEFINILKRQYTRLLHIKPVIRLINSGERILTGLGTSLKRMRRYTEKTMNQYGIEIINNKKIIKVTDHGVFLSDDAFIPCSMVISTIGQSRIILRGTENMSRDNLKRIYTNDYLQVENHANIWGGGDACHVKHYKTKEPCPSNALWSIKHGESAGRNIARAIKEQTLKPFNYKGLGQCASLGIGKGLGELYGIEFTGWFAWIMRWFFFNYFMPSRSVMLNAVSDWMFLLFFRRRKELALQKREIKAATKFKPRKLRELETIS